jgi:hypothetical protein
MRLRMGRIGRIMLTVVLELVLVLEIPNQSWRRS